MALSLSDQINRQLLEVYNSWQEYTRRSEMCPFHPIGGVTMGATSFSPLSVCFESLWVSKTYKPSVSCCTYQILPFTPGAIIDYLIGHNFITSHLPHLFLRICLDFSKAKAKPLALTISRAFVELVVPPIPPPARNLAKFRLLNRRPVHRHPRGTIISLTMIRLESEH